jgi:cysteine-rich repeat protein
VGSVAHDWSGRPGRIAVCAAALFGALVLGGPSDASAAFSNACAHGVCDRGTTASDTATAPPYIYSSGPDLSFSAANAGVAGIGARAFAQAAFGGGALVEDHASSDYADVMTLSSPTPFASATFEFVLRLTGGFSGSDDGPPCEHCGGQSPWTSEGQVLAELLVYRGFDLVAHPKIERKWNSNDGYINDPPTTRTVELSVLQQGTIGLLRTLTLRSAAGNMPCLSGSGTCGNPGSANVDGNFSATLVLEDFRLFDGESGEEILDFSLTGTDGIDYVAIDRGCGNGVVDAGETCDDANYRAGDCCAPNCQIEVAECEAGDCGDADDNGVLQAVDALATLRAAVGLAGCALCHCDADDSHDLSAGDALTILRSATGNAVPLRCVPCPA